MSVQNYLHALRRGWVVVVVGLLVGLGGGLAAFVLVPARYTAHTSLFVVTRLTDLTSAAYQGAQLSELRTKSYAELVTNPRVGQEVVRRLDLDTTADELTRRITATTAPGSVVIDVAVTDGSPTRAARIADTVGTVVGDLVGELERPYGSDGTPAIAVRVVQAATVPTTRSPSLEVALAVGALAGVVLGVVGALARAARDRSVRSPDQLRALTGAPTLGVIADDADVAMLPLTVRDAPVGPLAEAFRRLRGTLQHGDGGGTARVVAVTSALPGEGRTTVVVNLAVALGAAGHRVALLEADLRRPALAGLLGLTSAAGLSRILADHVDPDGLETALAAATQRCGRFDVLPAGPCPADPGELVAGRTMTAVLARLRASYDYVLVDCPPLLPVADAASIAPDTDGALLVCRYGATGQPQVATAAESLRAVSARVLGTVLTRVPRRSPAVPAPPHAASGRYRLVQRAEAVVAVPDCEGA